MTKMTTLTLTYIDRPISEAIDVDSIDFVASGLVLTMGGRRRYIPATRLISADW